MTSAFERVIDRVAREGPRLHARWSAERFARIGRGPCRTLWERLAERPSPDDEAAFSAYATLLREALGAGYLGRRADEGEEAGTAPWSNLLEYCLLGLIPRTLAAVPPPDRLAVLAATWNLGEGLLAGPPWIDRYVLAFAAELEGPAALEAFLVRVLEPVLESTAPSTWQGPFAQTVLDARAVLDPFLPGGMYLAAPTVLCVQDRRQPGVHLGVLLRPGLRSRILGLFPALEPFGEQAALPDVRPEAGLVRIGGQEVEVPSLLAPHRTVVAASGFVVASAVDSQRLWVLESP